MTKDLTAFLPKRDEQPKPHRFLLRLPPDLWAKIVRESEKLGVSTNDFLIAAASAAVQNGGKS